MTNNIPYTNLEQFVHDLGVKPPKKDSGGRYLRIHGIILIFLIWLAAFVLFVLTFTMGFIKGFTGKSYMINPNLIGLVFSIWGVLLLYVSSKIFIKGRKKEQTLKIYSDFNDTRLPIIYLRSFADDDPGMILRRSFGTALNEIWFPHEEALSKALRQIGPVLAFGQPRQNLPDIGAHRLYSDPLGDKWQNDLNQILEVCKLVVLKAGITNSLEWEFKKVFSQLPPEKILIYVNLSKKSYKIFSQKFQQWTAITLPLTKNASKFFIYFNQGFQYSTSVIKSPLLRRRVYQANTSPFLYALKPLFEQNGITWQKPKLNMLIYVLIGCLLLLGYAGSVLISLNNAKTDLLRAEAAYKEELAIHRQLAKDNPQTYNPAVAMTQYNLGNLYHTYNGFSRAKAEAAYLEALSMYSRLAKDNPQAYESYVAMTQNNLGVLYIAMHRYNQAEKLLIDALDVWENKVKEHPSIYTGYLVQTAGNSLDLYLSILDDKKYECLKPPQQLNFKNVETKLNNLSLNNATLKQKLSMCYGSCSWYLLFGSRFKESFDAAQKGLKIGSSQTWIKTNLAHALLFQNKYQEALRIYQELKILKNEEGKSYAIVCLEDLDELEKNGIYNKNVNKIRGFLKQR